MNAKQRKTLQAIFSDPVSGSIKWRDVESMLLALGAEIRPLPVFSVEATQEHGDPRELSRLQRMLAIWQNLVPEGPLEISRVAQAPGPLE